MKNCTNAFFEVSINSEKLAEYLTNIHQLIKDQDQKIKTLNKDLNKKCFQLKEDLQKTDILINRTESSLKELIIKQCFVLKNNIEKSKEHWQKVFSKFQDQLYSIDQQLISNRQKVHQTQSQADKAVEKCEQIKILRIEIVKMHQCIEEIRSDSFRLAIQEQISKNQEFKINQICQQVFFTLLQNDRVRQIILRKDKQNRFENVDKSNKKFEEPKTQNKHFQEKDAIFYASISERLDNLEKKLLGSHEQINKIVFPTKVASNFEQSQASTQQFPCFQNKTSSITETDKDHSNFENILFKQIASKIQKIQTVIGKKIFQMKKQLINDFQKSQTSEIINEKLSIIARKIQKEQTRINQLTIELKKYSTKRLDQKFIENLRYEIRQKGLDYQDNLDSKISKETFEKERAKTNERIGIIHQNLTEKADKIEIKKAIQFLQVKLKELILLVAGSYDQDREGSIKRLPFKCLSCDKSLQTKIIKIQDNVNESYRGSQEILDQMTKNMKKSQSSLKLRCATSRMRKHIRLNSGSANLGLKTIEKFQLD